MEQQPAPNTAAGLPQRFRVAEHAEDVALDHADYFLGQDHLIARRGPQRVEPDDKAIPLGCGLQGQGPPLVGALSARFVQQGGQGFTRDLPCGGDHLYLGKIEGQPRWPERQ
jgi:hypothetical protein